MNLATAKTSDLTKRLDDGRKARDALFKAEEKPTAEVADLRNSAVKLKLDIKKGRNVDESKKKLEEVEKKRAAATSERDARRRAIKLELRAIEQELAARDLDGAAAAYEKLSDAELEAFIGKTVNDARATLYQAKAARRVLNARASSQKIRTIAADLSEAEKIAIVEEIQRLGGALEGIEATKDGS